MSGKTRLKYSFSEAAHQKSVTVVELQNKGEMNIKTVPLVPKRDLVVIKGTYSELMNRSYYEGTTLPNDYVHVILTDEDDIIDAQAKLRTVYKNMMKLSYPRSR